MEFYSLHQKWTDEYGEMDNYSCFKNDSFDVIVGYYSSIKNAFEEKTRLEKFRNDLKRVYDKCRNCPIHSLTKRKYNNKPSKISDYCNHYNLMVDGNDISCSFCKKYDPFMDYEYYVRQIKTED